MKSKELLQSTELLAHFYPAKELVLVTDASDYGVRAVLSHKMEGRNERPIGYTSRSLNGTKRNCSTLDKEALAIILRGKKFHQFLYGHSFTTKTDHKPLESLLNEKKGIPLPEMPDSVPVPGETILLMRHLEGTPVHSGHIKEWTKKDPILSQVLRVI